jgi:hypothetical protein
VAEVFPRLHLCCGHSPGRLTVFRRKAATGGAVRVMVIGEGEKIPLFGAARRGAHARPAMRRPRHLRPAARGIPAGRPRLRHCGLGALIETARVETEVTELPFNEQSKYLLPVLVVPIFRLLPTAQVFAINDEDVRVTITRDLAADRKGKQPILYFQPPCGIGMRSSSESPRLISLDIRKRSGDT